MTLAKMFPKADAAPWAINPFNAQIDAFCDGHPLVVCQMLWPTKFRTEAETQDNAAAIVHAVNTHDALVEALEKIEAALRKDSRQKTINGDGTEYHLDGGAMWHAINAARAALKLARNETP